MWFLIATDDAQKINGTAKVSGGDDAEVNSSNRWLQLVNHAWFIL